MQGNDGIGDKGKKIMQVKKELGPKMRSELLLLIHLGGKFQNKNHKTEYVGGCLYMQEKYGFRQMNIKSLRGIVQNAQSSFSLMVNDNYSMWYGVRGKNLTCGRKKIENDDDINCFYQNKDNQRLIIMYVVDEPNNATGGPFFRQAQYPTQRPNSLPRSVVWPMQSNISQPTSNSTPNVPKPHNSQPNPQPTHVSSSVSMKPTETPKSSSLQPPIRRSPRLSEASQTQSTNPNPNATVFSPTNSPYQFTPPEKRSTPRVKHVAIKKKVAKGKNSKVKKATKKKKVVKNLFEDYSDGSVQESDEELSDFEFELGEEDRRDDLDDEIFLKANGDGNPLLSQIEKDLAGANSKGKEKVSQPSWADEDFLATNVHEDEIDSDDERSLKGSDDDEEQFPIFNPETDLKGKVSLFVGLQFNSIYDLRKAVQHHSIQNRYEYFFLHNESTRFEVYCRYKCDCKWNSKKAKIMYCVHSREQLRCHFKIKVVKLAMSDQFQIRALHLKHDCGFYHSNNKVTSEYLAERYLNDWKINPQWGLVPFIKKVYSDTGVIISYQKAWLTRSRVKQLLYGDAAEQYAKVYQYGFALLKHNPGSTAIITVDNSDNSPHPYFMRMYVCFEACKSGYKQGCRPIMGDDGCHLKGPYPGMLLAAVSKDGNNNIFTVAWAIVEVENTSTWTWFLELLMNDIGHVQGDGLTLMSDRQKGLMEAISTVAPKAAVRHCVRHIWANFKKKFPGTIYKENVWRAAKATSQQDFEMELEAIKFLSEEAYAYLDALPKASWSRHTFTTTSKSNMVTNNICETFNAVIREARDKPVITCLEWIRRYVMKRHAEKWDGVQSYNGRFMPCIGKVLGYIMEGAKSCYAIHSRIDEWEVDCLNDMLTVNLRTKTCSCNHFMLTGIPCKHAWSCIMGKRERPEDCVDEYYTKERYLKAYSSHIRPMPGFKHWELCSMPEPLPPPYKNMPGRPSLKKRRKEAGEEEEGKAKKLKKVGGPQKCSNCTEVGHKANKCARVAAAKAPPKEGGRPISNDPWSVANRKKKEAKAKMKYVPPTAKETTPANLTPSQSSLKGSNIPSTSNTNPGPQKAKQTKLQVKPSKKKARSLSEYLLNN